MASAKRGTAETAQKAAAEAKAAGVRASDAASQNAQEIIDIARLPAESAQDAVKEVASGLVPDGDVAGERFCIIGRQDACMSKALVCTASKKGG